MTPLSRALKRKEQDTTRKLAMDDKSYLESPEHKVGSAVYQLRALIADIWTMRLNAETADLVLEEKFTIDLSTSSLAALAEDIRVARSNMKEAAE